MTSSSNIVFTGLGAVCGAGLKIDSIWHAILNGRSAIAPITQWDASRWPVRVAAEVNARGLYDPLHRFLGTVGLIRDVSQSKQQDSTIHQLRQQLRRTDLLD